ncbi:Lrp/AsnC family transcriptional regulator, partial [Rhizobium ruizarguesonis]
MEQLDRFDRDILDIVQRDCQLKAETIAERIGLSVSAVQRRLKRLREEGIIKAEVA